jgi:hypothetical protein
MTDLLVDLLSQLEEAKYRRLFKSLIEDHAPPPGTPISYATEDSYVFAKHVKTGNFSCRLMFFQMSYLPYSFLGPGVSKTFFVRELGAALRDLQTRKRWPFDSEADPNVELPLALWPEELIYFFATNVHDSFIIDGAGSNADVGQAVAEAKKIFLEQLGVELFRGEPGELCRWLFGASTPISVARDAPDLVRGELLRLLNAPSDYSIIAREGRLSVVPTSIHGTFVASETNTRPIGEVDVGLAATVCLTAPAELRIPLGVLSDFEALINSTSTRESDLQAFLEEHPELLLGLDNRYMDVRPHPCLVSNQDGALIPDFMLRVEDSDIWDIVELKLPTDSIASAQPGIPSRRAARCIGQCLKYRHFFDYSANCARFAGRYGAHGFDPALVLVMGRGRQVHEWRNTKAIYPTVRVVPFDYLLDRGRECRASIRSKRDDRLDAERAR